MSMTAAVLVELLVATLALVSKEQGQAALAVTLEMVDKAAPAGALEIQVLAVAAVAVLPLLLVVLVVTAAAVLEFWGREQTVLLTGEEALAALTVLAQMAARMVAVVVLAPVREPAAVAQSALSGPVTLAAFLQLVLAILNFQEQT